MELLVRNREHSQKPLPRLSSDSLASSPAMDSALSLVPQVDLLLRTCLGIWCVMCGVLMHSVLEGWDICCLAKAFSTDEDIHSVGMLHIEPL